MEKSLIHLMIGMLQCYLSNISGKEFEFKLGAGQVIKGWDQGLLEYPPELNCANNSMCVGEKRKLVIPPDMAYGDRSMGAIKAGSTLGTQSTATSTNN